MVPSEFTENASLRSCSVDLYKKIFENVFSIKTRNIIYQTLQMRTILNWLTQPIRICICNQLGLSFQRIPENFSSGHGWFLSNFPPHKKNYPLFRIATLHKKIRKNYRYQILSILSFTRTYTQWFTKLRTIICGEFREEGGDCKVSHRIPPPLHYHKKWHGFHA